jgi:hypothetical protein
MPAILPARPFRLLPAVHAPGELLTALALDHGKVVLALHLQPELRVVAEIPANAQHRVGGDRADRSACP